MPDNFEHNAFLTVFLKQKIDRHSFNSSDSADSIHKFVWNRYALVWTTYVRSPSAQQRAIVCAPIFSKLRHTT